MLPRHSGKVNKNVQFVSNDATLISYIYQPGSYTIAKHGMAPLHTVICTCPSIADIHGFTSRSTATLCGSPPAARTAYAAEHLPAASCGDDCDAPSAAVASLRAADETPDSSPWPERGASSRPPPAAAAGRVRCAGRHLSARRRHSRRPGYLGFEFASGPADMCPGTAGMANVR